MMRKCVCLRVFVGNKITEKSLPVFLKSLKVQKEGGGLLRLCLQVCAVCTTQIMSANFVPHVCFSFTFWSSLILLASTNYTINTVYMHK